MKEYLLLFWNESGDGQYKLDPARMKEIMTDWQAWIGNIAMNGHLISTKPINWEGLRVGNSGAIEGATILEKQMVTGFMICKAKGIQEVASWAQSCPILQHPAGFTEIREISPFEM